MLWLSLICFLLSCGDPVKNGCYGSRLIKYKNDTTISSRSGDASDSLTFFFPVDRSMDTINWFTVWDSSQNEILLIEKSLAQKKDIAEMYKIPIDKIGDSSLAFVDSPLLKSLSYELYKMKEPVLSNFYLNKTIYRLKCYPAYMGVPYVINVVKDADSAYIQTKVMEFQITSPLMKVNNMTNDLENSRTLKNSFTVNAVKHIKINDFLNIDSLIKEYNITSQPQWDHTDITDASLFLLEVHDKCGYYFIFRYDDKKLFSKIKDEIIELSDLDKSSNR